MSEFFNSEISRLSRKTILEVKKEVKVDKSKIKWSDDLFKTLSKGKRVHVDKKYKTCVIPTFL